MNWGPRSSWIICPPVSFAPLMSPLHKLFSMDNQLLAGKRVLVVEDEMLVLMTLEDMLSDLGCTSIMIAEKVETALALIASNAFDLGTLDVNLDGTKSYAVADALERHRVPFAFSTGYGLAGIDQAYASRPVLHKPFGKSEFRKVVSSLL